MNGTDTLSQKPQDISDPCLVSTQKTWGKRTSLYIMASNLTDYEICDMYYGLDDVEKMHICVELDEEFDRGEGDAKDLEKLKMIEVDEEDSDSYGTQQRFQKRALVCGKKLYCDIKTTPGETMLLPTATEISQWLLAAEELQRQPEFCSDDFRSKVSEMKLDKPWLGNCIDLFYTKSGPFRPIWERNADLISSHAPNFKSDFTNNEIYGYTWWTAKGRTWFKDHAMWHYLGPVKYLLVLLTVLSTAYGGVHLTAWNFVFPSSIEQILWKIAAAIVMAGLPSLILSSLLASLVLKIHRLMADSPHHDQVQQYSQVLANFFHIISSLIVLLYVLSRLYLVGESFASLRHVPVGVYAAIPWVQLVPHI